MHLFDFYKYPIAVGCKVSPSPALIESTVPKAAKAFKEVIVYGITNACWIDVGGARYHSYELQVVENELGQPVVNGKVGGSGYSNAVSAPEIEPSDFTKAAEELYQRLIVAPILATDDGTLFLDMINLIKDMSAKLDKIR